MSRVLIILITLTWVLTAHSKMPYILGAASDLANRNYELSNGYVSKEVNKNLFFGFTGCEIDIFIHLGKYSDSAIVKTIKKIEVNRKTCFGDGQLRYPVGAGIIYDLTLTKYGYDYYRTSDLFIDIFGGVEFLYDKYLFGLNVKYIKKIVRYSGEGDFATYDYNNSAGVYFYVGYQFN